MFKSELKTLMNAKIASFGYSYEDIASTAGYSGSSLNEAAQRIERTLGHTLLTMDSAGYDYKYTTEELIRTICSILKIEKEAVDDGISKLKAEAERLRKRFHGYVRIISTNEVRPSGWASAMGHFAKTTLKLPVELTDNEHRVRMHKVREICMDHYKKSGGSLGGKYGKIKYYRYYYAENDFEDIKP